MTNGLVKRRIKELKRELKELETYPAKIESLKLDIKYRYLTLKHELEVAQLTLSFRQKDRWSVLFVDLAFCFIISMPLNVLTLGMGNHLKVLGLNFLCLFLLLIQARQWMDSIHPHSMALWFLSEAGGSLPEWYRYRSMVYRHLKGLLILFVAVVVANFFISSFYAIGMFMGPIYVLGCFAWDINAFKKETLLECYDLAKKAIDADRMIKEALAKS